MLFWFILILRFCKDYITLYLPINWVIWYRLQNIEYFLLWFYLIEIWYARTWTKNIYNFQSAFFGESHVNLNKMIFCNVYFHFVIFIKVSQQNYMDVFTNLYYLKIGKHGYSLAEEVLGCTKNIVFIDFACNRWEFFGSREF